jgi:hypothetical protein
LNVLSQFAVPANSDWTALAAMVKKAYGRELIAEIETPPPHVLWGAISAPLF